MKERVQFFLIMAIESLIALLGVELVNSVYQVW
jgi:hypothetical protein